MALLAFIFAFPYYCYSNIALASEYSHRIQYIYPQENQTIYYKNITLSWSNGSVPHSGIIQISENKEFTKIITESQVTQNSYSTSALGKCREYYWRVLSMDKKSDGQYSFFKTTTLLLHFQTPCCLNIIPTSIEDKALIYVDNPEFRNYNIAIHDLDNFERVLERHSASEYQCIPVYKFRKGRYLIRIKVPDEENNNISEILMTMEE